MIPFNLNKNQNIALLALDRKMELTKRRLPITDSTDLILYIVKPFPPLARTFFTP